jgi:hypothetical protein
MTPNIIVIQTQNDICMLASSTCRIVQGIVHGLTVIDHCVDYLRQYSECRADLTPLKLYYSESARRLMVDFE